MCSPASRFFRAIAFAQSAPLPSSNSTPVQRPFATRRVMLSLQIIAYYGLIRNSRTLQTIYSINTSGLCPTALYGLVARGSPICSTCLYPRAAFPTPVDRMIARICCFTIHISLHPLYTGSTSTFTIVAGSPMSPLTRLQSSLYATARWVCSPCTGKDFYFRACGRPGRPGLSSDITTRVNR